MSTEYTLGMSVAAFISIRALRKSSEVNYLKTMYLRVKMMMMLHACERVRTTPGMRAKSTRSSTTTG